VLTPPCTMRSEAPPGAEASAPFGGLSERSLLPSLHLNPFFHTDIGMSNSRGFRLTTSRYV
jgi:hypothetical protein